MNLMEDREERYHKMIDEVHDYAILLMDKNGTILNWNKGAQNIKGYKESEIVGKNFRTFYLPEDRENKVPEMLIEEATTKGRATAEGYRLRKDGTTFWGSIVITALHDDDGNVIGFSKVTRDLTERKRAEDRIKQYTLELEKQNKELAQYAYITSHDLQEPLRKIQTFAHMAADSNDIDTIKTHLGKINASAERMSALIKGVLNFIRISEGEKVEEDVNLNDTLDHVRQDFELMIGEKGAVINTDKLPVIKGKGIQLYQLFSNLISNSLKFNDKQPVITIKASPLGKAEQLERTELDAECAYIKITVSDNGIGFDEKYTAQIFEIFKRLNDQKKYVGTGLGLSLCRKIVENHGGTITASSTPNEGATFTIILPVLQCDES